MRWFLSISLACVTACGPSLAEDDERGCAEVMYDSLLAPYPTHDDWCFPGLGEDSPTGRQGTGECSSEPPGVVLIWGRFFGACSSCGPGFSFSDCRPLICATDEDCPSFLTRNSDDEVVTNEYECRNSLCQNVDTERFPIDYVDRSDAELLCRANIERDDFYEGEAFCPGVDPLTSKEPCPLPLPDGCMQP
ncbi:MAG TPA: hypothetical protein VM869_02830 [Enhygromyxa sp.]|nr:hypothetical protein [Enhygromyxa sp.]